MNPVALLFDVFVGTTVDWFHPVTNAIDKAASSLNRHNHLQWDCLFCSDLFNHFKPDPETYLGACDYINHEAYVCRGHISMSKDLERRFRNFEIDSGTD